MRYILKRELFLDQNKINEVFQNEVSWGGSWVGRLINSTIRRNKIKKDSETIDGIIQAIQNTLDDILQSSINKDLRVKLYRLRLKKMVSNIKDVSLSNDKDKIESDCENADNNSKLTKLIGKNVDVGDQDFTDKWKDLPDCLIQDLFKEIEEREELKKLFTKEQLDKLVNVHSDFAVSLRRFRWEKCNVKTSGGIKGIQSEYEGEKVVPNSDKNLKDQISVKSNENLKYNIFKNFSEYKSLKLYLEASTTTPTTNTNAPTTTTPTTTTPTTTTPTTTDAPTTTTSTTTSSPNTNTKPEEPETIASIWKKYFLTTEPLSAFRLTQNDEKELQDLENKLSNNVFKLDYKVASDKIIELFDLLNQAYQLFATEQIPSGRPGGRVSMRTFREYQKLGGSSQETKASSSSSDAGGEAIIPGPGPWAKKIVYEKFQKYVMNLLKDQKYRRIFANINFNYPGAEDTFNDSYKWRTLLENSSGANPTISGKERMGPTIFNLLQDLATPSKCGPDLIDVAIRKYFNQPPPPPKTPVKAAKYDQNEDTKERTLEYRAKETLNLTKNYYWCIPAKPTNLSNQDEYSIEEGAGSIFRYINKGHIPIFIDPLNKSGVNDIKFLTKSDTELIFRPIRLTFATPLAANEYYVKNKEKYTKYINLSSKERPKTNLYYGYICCKKDAKEGDSFWVFYLNDKSSDKKIDFQCFTITSGNFKNIESDDAGEIKLSALFAYPGEIKNEVKKIENKDSGDITNYESFFDEEVGNNNESFKKIMEKYFGKDSKNDKRIEVISNKF